jgi:hypothetical protein
MATFWSMLGVSRAEGMALGLGLVVGAVLFAFVRARSGSRSRGGVSL